MRLSITSIITLIVLVSIQVLLPSGLFLGAKIDFALIMVTYVAVVSGNNMSIVFGFLAGLLVDSFSSAHFGMHALTYTLVAFAMTMIYNKVQFKNILTMVLITLLSTAGKYVLLLLITALTNAIFSKTGYPVKNLLLQGLIEMGLNMLFAPVVYIIMNLLSGKKLQEE